jgi:two-component system, response regulator PdtaR
MEGTSVSHPVSRPPPAVTSDGPGRATGETELPRILIVEDEYLVSMELEARLSEAGFEVVGVATTASEALRLAVAERPVLIVMDIRLAGRQDGIDAAVRIYNTTGIRCIFATAHAEPQIRERAKAASPIGWLSKPYQFDALVAMIREALREPNR